MSATVYEPAADRPATVGRTLGVARVARVRLAQASLLGAGAIGASIALMGTSAWLISRAALHPSEASLTLAIVGVQVFGLSRGFLRYGERLVGHDAALRVLADLRLRVYGRLEAIAPAGLPLFRRGDLVSRVVDDVDSLQDVVLRVIQPFAVACLVGAGTVAVMWMLLPGAGAVLLVALVVSATAVPWLTGRLARREESKQASARGELGAAIVDLIEGAPELTVMGGTGEQLERITLADRRLRATARQGAGTTGIGLGLTTALAGLASWGALALGVSATHGGHLDGALLAVLALVPLAAFELVAPLPAATQALQRSRTAAGRVCSPPRTPRHPSTSRTPRCRCPARCPDRTRSGCARCGPVIPAPTGRCSAGWISTSRRGAGWPWSGRAGPASRRWPTSWCASCPSTAARRPSTASPSTGSPPTTCAGWSGWSSRARTSSPRPWPRTFGWAGARPATTSWWTCWPGSAWATGSPGCPPGWPPGSGRRVPASRAGSASASRWPRALLADFSILIFDEPAEHLDPAAADSLTADLLALTENHSTLFITHRLSGLDQVDEIIVLHEGRVLERGTHTDLVTAGGRYAGLWWDELMNDGPATTAASPPALGCVLDEAVLNEGSDTP